MLIVDQTDRNLVCWGGDLGTQSCPLQPALRQVSLMCSDWSGASANRTGDKAEVPKSPKFPIRQQGTQTWGT